MIGYLTGILAMTFLGAAASLFLKRASGSEKIWNLIKDSNLYVGGFLYLVSAVFNILLLKYLDYSVVLPLTSLTYVWTMLLSYLVLKEKITGKKIVGVVFILAGGICVSIADKIPLR